jgi:chemotaxis signal transduction protein
MKLLMVSVGRGRYAVAADAVAHIMDPALEPEFRREAPDGAIYLGARYPVVDLHEGAEEVSGRSCVYLLVEGNGRRAFVPVDSAEAIRDVAPGEIAPLPTFIFARGRRLFRGLFADGQEPRLLVDVEGLL